MRLYQTEPDIRAVRELVRRGDVRAAAAITQSLSIPDLAKLLQALPPAELARLEATLDAERLADVLEALGPRGAAELLIRTHRALAADVLEAMEADDAAEVLEAMDHGRAADVLEDMGPDEAANVVNELEDAAAERIVAAMGPAEVRDLVLAREARLARESRPLRRLLSLLGPGLVTGASDDDPSGIGTYAVAGATFGFATLWTALVTFPLMSAVQYVCAKIGIVTGRGLAEVLRRHYPRWVLYPAVLSLLAANTINAGADIGAIAAAINLLVPIPIPIMIVPIALLVVGSQLLGSYHLIARTFKWLTLALFAYIASAFFAQPDWGAVVRGTLVPTISLDSSFLAILVAIFGTTISPYLFFWQTSHEIEEQSSESKRWLWYRMGTGARELRYAGWDVGAGMLLSNLVMYFIILATAATLHANGKTDVTSAADAAEALRPFAGDAASVLLALGLICTGMLAVPILTGSAAYAVADAFSWRGGLSEPPRRAPQFYGVIVASTLVGTLINFIGINPIDALVWTAVLNGLLAPPLLVLLMLIANNRAIVGDHVNSRVTNLLGWAATAFMTAAAVGLLATWRQS